MLYHLLQRCTALVMNFFSNLPHFIQVSSNRTTRSLVFQSFQSFKQNLHAFPVPYHWLVWLVRLLPAGRKATVLPFMPMRTDSHTQAQASCPTETPHPSQALITDSHSCILNHTLDFVLDISADQVPLPSGTHLLAKS
jgi:hypothetical protein